MAAVPTTRVSRRALVAFGALAGAGALTGCPAVLRRDISPICPKSPNISNPQGLFTIDAHCHVFNGTDIQVAEFLARVAVRQNTALGLGARLLGEILEGLAWNKAPTAEEEICRLREVSDEMYGCDESVASRRLDVLAQEGYAAGRKALTAAVERSPGFQSLRSQLKDTPAALDADSAARLQALRIIETLPAQRSQYRELAKSRAQEAMTAQERSVVGMIDFVLQNFQFRYVSVMDYLYTYNVAGGQVVDLMRPSLVDYDWWLNMGRSTRTSLADQVRVMSTISVVTGGRVHAFAPYDPLRQLAGELGKATENSFELVQDAIRNKGLVGVKLYPPMGFAPLGNETVQTENGTGFWGEEWLPGWMRDPSTGRRLDDAMRKLFTWCQSEGVPIMAHTAQSNGAAEKFEALTDPRYWYAALKEFPGLRVSFGHFGDSTPVEDGVLRAKNFARLMGDEDEKPGKHAYADAGYFVEVVSRKPELREVIRRLYDESASGPAPLANRLMYGTDWEMTLVEGRVDSYLDDFASLMSELETRPAIRAAGLSGLAERFFSGNAVDWVGLRQDQPARRRLQNFYARHGIEPPDWAIKIDRQA